MGGNRPGTPVCLSWWSVLADLERGAGKATVPSSPPTLPHLPASSFKAMPEIAHYHL